MKRLSMLTLIDATSLKTISVGHTPDAALADA
jgi:hypothetical protein